MEMKTDTEMFYVILESAYHVTDTLLNKFQLKGQQSQVNKTIATNKDDSDPENFCQSNSCDTRNHKRAKQY